MPKNNSRDSLLAGLLMGLRNDEGLMRLCLSAAAPGVALGLDDGSAGDMSVAAQTGSRRGRAFSNEPTTAAAGGAATSRGMGLRSLTRNFFDCHEIRSRVVSSRNRREKSGGIGTPCKSLRGTRRSETRRREQSGASQLASSQIQDICKAEHRFGRQARSLCWASPRNALQTT